MGKHDYTPQQALELITRRLTAQVPELAVQVQAAVNAGKDVQEIQQTGKKSSRYYRRAVPYSPEEALQIAVEVLKAHFIEQPLFTNSFLDDIAQSALGIEDLRASVWGSKESVVRTDSFGAEKNVEIEVQTETEVISDVPALTDGQKETLPMIRWSVDEIRQQERNFDYLTTLVDFT